MDGKASLAALLGDDVVAIRVRVREPDVVFVKSILEASEGLGAVFAEPRPPGRGADHDGGAIVIAGPRSRERELRETLRDLRGELEFSTWDDDSDG